MVAKSGSLNRVAKLRTRKQNAQLIAMSVVIGLAIGSAYGLHAGLKVRSIIISDAVCLIIAYTLYRLVIVRKENQEH